MEIKKFENGYEIVNESGNTRNGFYHKSVLFKNGYEIVSNRVSYLNRTWECYRYQTSMYSVVNKALDKVLEDIKRVYMYSNNYSRLTDKRRAELEEKQNRDCAVIELRALLAQI